jgi:hypothetical protein
VLTPVLAWLATLAVCVAAVLFGQSTRTGPRRRRRSGTGRVGLFLSLSGPWLSVLAAGATAAATGAWLLAAAAGSCGVVLTAAVGFVLSPR